MISKALKMAALLVFVIFLAVTLADDVFQLRLFWPYDKEVFGWGILVALLGVGCIAFFMPREWAIMTKGSKKEDESE